MQKLGELLGKTLANIGAESGRMGPNDYMQDGLVHCKRCKEPRQARRTVPDFLREQVGDTMLIHRSCACQRKASEDDYARFAEESRQQEAERLRADGIKDANLRGCTFAADDQPESTISKACRRYVAKWDEMRAKNIGIMMTGEPGGGKTFYAAAIANALIDRNIAAIVTTIPDVSAHMNADHGAARDDVLDRIKRVPLLVLDDYGFERATSYGMENAYTITNARYTAHKPLIITTNLTQAEMENPPDVGYSRIMSRLTEMCPAPLKCAGSRRPSIAADKRKAVMDILFGED